MHLDLIVLAKETVLCPGIALTTPSQLKARGVLHLALKLCSIGLHLLLYHNHNVSIRVAL